MFIFTTCSPKKKKSAQNSATEVTLKQDIEKYSFKLYSNSRIYWIRLISQGTWRVIEKNYENSKINIAFGINDSDSTKNLRSKAYIRLCCSQDIQFVPEVHVDHQGNFTYEYTCTSPSLKFSLSYTFFSSSFSLDSQIP